MRRTRFRDLGWHVVEEVDGQVELGAVAASLGRRRARFEPSSVVPPRTGRLTGYRDHRVHEHQGAHRDLRGDQRHSEPAERLRDQHHVIAAANRVDDQAGVLGQARARIVAGQVDRDRLVPGLAQQRGHAMPVPGGTTGARDQDKGTHT